MHSNGHGTRRRDITSSREIPSFGYFISSDGRENRDTNSVDNFPAVPPNRLKNGFDYVDSVAKKFEIDQPKSKPVKTAGIGIGGNMLMAILWIGLIATIIYVVCSHFNNQS